MTDGDPAERGANRFASINTNLVDAPAADSGVRDANAMTCAWQRHLALRRLICACSNHATPQHQPLRRPRNSEPLAKIPRRASVAFVAIRLSRPRA